MAELEPGEAGGRCVTSSGCSEEEPPPAKRPRTISELRQEIETSLNSGQSLTLQYEGAESLEEVLEQLFSEPVESVDNLEMMYQKLIAELEAAGLKSSQIDNNDIKKKEQSTGFRNSKELIEFLLQDEDDGAASGSVNENRDRDPRRMKKDDKSEGGGSSFTVTGSPTHVVVVRKENEYNELFIDEGLHADVAPTDDVEAAAQSSNERSLIVAPSETAAPSQCVAYSQINEKCNSSTTDGGITDGGPVNEHLDLSLDGFISVPTTEIQGQPEGTAYFKTENNLDELIKDFDPNFIQQLYQEDLDCLDDNPNVLPADTGRDTQLSAKSIDRAHMMEDVQPISQVESSETADSLSTSQLSAVSVPSGVISTVHLGSHVDKELRKQYEIKKCYVNLEKCDKLDKTPQITSKSVERMEIPQVAHSVPPSTIVEKEMIENACIPSSSQECNAPKSEIELNLNDPKNSKDLVQEHSSASEVVSSKSLPPLRGQKYKQGESPLKKRRIVEVVISSSESDDEYVPLGPAIIPKHAVKAIIKEDLDCKVIDDKPSTSSPPKTVQQVAHPIITEAVSVPETDKQRKADQKPEAKILESAPVTPPKNVLAVSRAKSPLPSPGVLVEEKELKADKVSQETAQPQTNEDKTEIKPKLKKKFPENVAANDSLSLPAFQDDSNPVKTPQSQAAGPSKPSKNEERISGRKTRGRPGRRSKAESDSFTSPGTSNIQNSPLNIYAKKKKNSKTESSSSSESVSSVSSVSSKESFDLPAKKRKKSRKILSSESEVESVLEDDSEEFKFKHPMGKQGKPKVLPDSNESLTDMMVTECFKKIWDIDLLIRIMNKTRPFRKEFLPANEFDVSIALKKFPGLRDYRIMKHEMNRLTERKGQKLNRFNIETLEKKFAQEMRTASTLKKRPGLERNELWVQAIEMSKDPNKSPEEKKVLGMYCLCFHLIENDANGSLFRIRRENQRSKWKEMGFPTIDILETDVFSPNAADMWVYAEGLQVCKVPNFYEGVLTCYAMHYVFDMEYHEKVRNFYEHFDTLIGFMNR